MYMYEYKRGDGRVTYPLCFIWYNPSGCDVHLNMIYGQTTEKLVTLLKASKVFNVQVRAACLLPWLLLASLRVEPQGSLLLLPCLNCWAAPRL